MSAELQERAKVFLKRAVPKSVDYVPGSMAEKFIATYAKKGKLPNDCETTEMLELVIMESSGAGQGGSPEAAEYFRESTAILEAIHAEG